MFQVTFFFRHETLNQYKNNVLEESEDENLESEDDDYDPENDAEAPDEEERDDDTDNEESEEELVPSTSRKGKSVV